MQRASTLSTCRLFLTRPQIPPGWLLLSCLAAFALNMSVFLLIGRSSALTMNVAGTAGERSMPSMLLAKTQLGFMLLRCCVRLSAYCGSSQQSSHAGKVLIVGRCLTVETEISTPYHVC